MNKKQKSIHKDIAAIHAVLSAGQPKTESGFSVSEESRIIAGHNLAAVILAVALALAGGVAAFFYDKGFLIAGLLAAWLFKESRIR